jgi:CopG family nickel-responsive transcriptional regulator
MERVSISLDGDLLAEFDDYIARHGYENRSEAIRDLVRHRLDDDRLEGAHGTHAVGCLSYVYNHHQRHLAERLTQEQHDNHDFVLSNLHVHLDHENCLEVVLMRGHTGELRSFAAQTTAQTGVRHGQLHLIAADIADAQHKHGAATAAHAHSHTHPKT